MRICSHFLKLEVWNLGVLVLLTFLKVIDPTSGTINQKQMLTPLNATFAQIYYDSKREGSVINLPAHYEGCGVVKGCTPEKCSISRNCDYFVTYYFVPVTEYIHFQVFGKRTVDHGGALCSMFQEEKKAYLAIAFTETPKMENALVIECSIAYNSNSTERGGVLAWYSNNNYRRWKHDCSEGTRTGKLMYCQVDLDFNDHIMCEFRMKYRVVMMREIFNLKMNQYYMHIISGCDLQDIIKDGLEKGAKHFTTDKKVFMDTYEQRKGWKA